MSFFDDASLAFLPSGGAGKDGKAYSIKPTDGTGDFTFSRGSNLTATRVGPTGLIEKGRENLLKRSNNFSDVLWVQASTTRTSGQTGYDGSSDAWEVTRASGGSVILYQAEATSGVNTFSVYVKVNASNGFGISFDSSSYAYFDISDTTRNGAVATNAIVTSSQTYIGNNFYRLSVTASGSFSQVRFTNCSADGTTADAFGGTHIIQDAQLEVGTIATDYIESGASTGKAGLLENEPRFDYSGGATCPSLLLEPQRVQLIGQSEYLDGITWSGKIGGSFDTNVTTSPEGLSNASLLKEDSSNGSHFAYKDFNLTSGSTYTISIFAKANGVNRNLGLGDGGLGWGTGFNVKFDLTAGTATGGKIEPMGNGWYRCSVTGTTNATTSRLIVYSTLGGATSYQGDGTSGVYLYGFQIEEGSYPTSYIPNHSGGSATRTDDDATLSNINTNIVDITGDFTFFVDNTGSLMKGDELYYYFIELYWDAVTAVRYYSTNNGGWYFKPDNSYTGFSNSVGRQIIKYENGVFYHFLNGSKSTDTRTMATTNSLSRIKFLTNTQGKAGYLDVKQALLFNTALSDADCITLTT